MQRMATSSTLVSYLQKDFEEACTSIGSLLSAAAPVSAVSSSSTTYAAVALQRNRDLHTLLQRLLSLHAQLPSIDEQQKLSLRTRNVKEARNLARDSVSSCLAQLSQAEEKLSLQVSAAKQNLRRRSIGSSVISVPLDAIIALSKNCTAASCAGIRHQNHPADRQDVRHAPPFPLSQDPYFLNKYRASLPPAHLPPLVLSWSLDDVLEPWQKDIIGGFLDPNAAAAGSPTDEPDSDDGEGEDHMAFYRDMDDKLSDGEDEDDGAPVSKKQRSQADSSQVEDYIVDPMENVGAGELDIVDSTLEEVLSPEEIQALYSSNHPEEIKAHDSYDQDDDSDGVDEQQPSSLADDPDCVDQLHAAEVAHDADELGDLNPDDMALFSELGQGSSP